MVDKLSGILGKAAEVLREFPLCDRCLGRLFAGYGRGLTNEERGRAIKTLLTMELHQYLLSESNDEGVEQIMKVAENACYPLTSLVRQYLSSDVQCRKCYICEGKLNDLIYEVSLKAAHELRELNVKTFVVGVKSGSSLELREKDIALAYELDSWESVNREVKREVGKRIKALTGLKPNFKSYDAVVMIDLDRARVTVEPQPVYIEGSYVKVGRFISQMTWVGRDGSKRYDLSIEEVCRAAAGIYEGKDIKIHAAGREDADARMLGDGRPLILEVRMPKKRYLNLSRVSAELSNEWVRIVLKSYVDRRRVSEVKEGRQSKVYRIIIYSEEGLSVNDLNKIIESFSNRKITQRTPTRVLHRRSDTVRVREVYEVKGRLLGDQVAEVLVKCEGGLYVKELVTGDYGRTNPSFSSIIGKELTVLFLDVMACLPSS